MSRWNDIVLLGCFSLAVLAAAFLTDGVPMHLASLTTQGAGGVGPCQHQEPIRANGQRIVGGVLTMNTNDAIRIHICKRSTLTFTASGTKAHGAYARLVVSLNDKQLLSSQAMDPHRYTLTLSQPGWVVIALVNAISEGSGSRILRIRELSVSDGS